MRLALFMGIYRHTSHFRIRVPDLSDLASFANEMNLFEGLGPEWARSPQISEGFRPILTDGEERINETLVLPLRPVWGNLGSLNGLGESVLIDDAISLSEPISNFETSPQRNFSDESFAIGSVSDFGEFGCARFDDATARLKRRQ
ncbi:hypothetical protein DID88_010350 [Monilinia fructigena]|uniref:Uncharacterized protein n=1 Tax=Monilinia fructigena TaxID=38457 RepID=A0A395IM87_9HELO|nr:hypothetical protein DID88_010350 [Monilinia fructigena]